MKRLLFTTLFAAVAIAVSAQPQHGLKGNYNTDNFPKISFVWNSPSPESLDKSQFVLTEDGQNVDFDFKSLSNNNTEMPYKKSILFLWEDMAVNQGEYEFAKNTLKRFFSETPLSGNDEFCIAVFNRKDDGTPVLTPLHNGFTSSTSVIDDAIDRYPKSKRKYVSHPLESDLYLAINSGIDMLKEEPSDRLGVIVVITAGMNMKAPGASTEMATTRQNAEDAGVPIYVLKYPLRGNTPEVNTLAESTYGQYASDKNADYAVSYLKEFYSNMDSRAYGHDYHITFTTSAKRDGKPHNISLAVGKVTQNIPAFTSPNMTFGDWVSENTILFIILVILGIGLIVLTILLIRRSIAKRNKKIADTEAGLQNEINRSNQALNEMQQRHDLERRQREQEATLKAQAENDERLLNLMHTKNLCPRLQCRIGENSFNYYMDKIKITLGRNNDNDVVLPAQTVSGYHAEIAFDGINFNLTNKSHTYKQGIIVNGQFFQQCILKNGDMIGIGEALVTFYI